ncbi:calcium-binding protein [Grimontia sp. SpTr1]|uniref:calcium-binding protein n=1 Tax=Grimontia sp. SpTr1 TaxID=2995319 RepID=UPI00248AF885|nr:calcium-binding protein [Grimontia sp. SpTr1]
MSVISNEPVEIYGESDVDFLYGSIQRDYFNLEQDTDDITVIAYNGDDDIFGSYGDDLLVGGAGNDFIYSRYGSNVMRGGSGDDQLLSKNHPSDDRGEYRDVLSGGSGNDVLSSESSQNCTMDGGSGDDIFSFRDLGAAQSGVSFCIGGEGADIFRFYEFEAHEDIDPTNSVVRIKDFEVGVDSLNFHYYSDEYRTDEDTSYIIKQMGSNMVIDFEDKVTIMLHGVDSNAVTMSDLFANNQPDPIDPILY